MCEITNVVVLVMLVACAVCDWKKKEIPLLFLVMMSGVTVFCLLFCHQGNLWQHVGGILLGSFFFLISRFSKEAIGYGDSWIILLLGLYLGLSVTIELLFVASFVAGVGSLFFLWKKRWRKKATMPFVPFLALAYVGVVFF